MKLRMCIDSTGFLGALKQRQLAVFAMALTVLATGAQPYAFGADSGTTIATTGDTAAEAQDTRTAGENLSLDNIQDIAFTLQRVRLQAISVYMEATRKKVYRFQLNVPSVASMPTTTLEDEGKYLPLRKAWIAYFVGCLEPLITILNDHLKHLDQRTAESGIPSQYLAEWHGIVGEWSTALKDLNHQLDVCAALLDDPAPGNIAVAKAAMSIDKQVSVLEKILHKASKFLRDKAHAS